MEEVSSLESFHQDQTEDSKSEEQGKSTEEKRADDVNDDYDQVSSVETFDGDDNSNTAAETVRDNDDDADAAVEGEGEIDSCRNNSAAMDETAQEDATEFEEVDTNAATLNTNTNDMDESDILGDADMTLGTVSKNVDGEHSEKSVSAIDGGNDADYIEQDESVDGDLTSNTYSPTLEDKNKDQNIGQDESMQSLEEDGNDIAKSTHNEDGSQDKEMEAESENVTRNNSAPDDEDENDSVPVENVQEPEESDVCLIPDDTDTQMTEQEKEQAILARENAEREEEGEESANTNEKDASENDHDKDQNSEGAAISKLQDVDMLEEDVQAESSASDGGTATKNIISWILPIQQTCKQCAEEKMCAFRYLVTTGTELTEKTATKTYNYVCSQECCTALLAENPGKYFIRRKKFLVEEHKSVKEADEDKNQENSQYNSTTNQECLECKIQQECKYFFKQDDEFYSICSDACFNVLNEKEPDKFKLKRHSIRVRNIGSTMSDTKTLGAESGVVARTAAEAEAARQERVASFTRRCAECLTEVTLGERNLLWESMDFCNEICLGKYQRTIGSHCQTCNGEVPQQALSKYCVRFGFDVRQFCCASCLNEFKKGLKTCSCCQKDISGVNEGFLAPVGDKEQFKDFCSQSCMRRYDNMCNPKKKLRSDSCAVCNNEKTVRVEIVLDNKEFNFCSNPCFSAFKFVSNIVADQCGMCCKYFERKGAEPFTIYTERRAKVFCSRICMNVFIIVNRRIVSCQWCKVKKYNFDMIYKQRDGKDVLICSLNCLTLYEVSINAFSRTIIKCDNCNISVTPEYHLTMSDASMRNFCNYQCVMQFQNQFANAPLSLDSESTAESPAQRQINAKTTISNGDAPFPTGLPKRIKLRLPHQGELGLATSKSATNVPTVPIISTVSSLSSGETESVIGNVTIRRGRMRGRKMDSPPPLTPLSNQPTLGRGRPRKGTSTDYNSAAAPISSLPANNKQQRNQTQYGREEIITETKIVTVPPLPPKVRNVQTSCKPQQINVSLQAQSKMVTIGVQTENDYFNKVMIPVPVPLYVPVPMLMYSAPFPVPIPIPLPIPVPVFIPTTRNSAQGILKEIKKIQDKMPADPYEAELLMMAEMVAEEKANSDSDSDAEPEDIKPANTNEVTIEYDNNNVNAVEVATQNSAYGEDVLQMAFKMASGEYDQPTVDLESAMTANTITNPPPGVVEHENAYAHVNVHLHQQQEQHVIEAQRGGRGRKRGSVSNRSQVNKRPRLHDIDDSLQQQPLAVNTPHNIILQQHQEMQQPTEKPDATMCLKFTFGVNAWRQWVLTKNADMEKSSLRRRPFKTDLLQMTADELNYSLCLFIKEVRKPNGAEYAPDTIYYLVLGLQQYLYENGRIDNIFTDSYYERFTDCLDEVARKFSVLYNDSQYIVTRVEEEHLWECKQLGAHSPHVLLSTLMFFNTKHFNLTSVDEHMQLSFSHIMKHWKRSGQNAKVPGTRNVLLRFYPPQTGLENNPRKKKVYEQQENEENPLRCPVRLYEFYLSKCPESVKTRNDVFYLQPERSCVPDSPVWYSTQALSQDALQKMLHRVKMVKEINIALLTS